MRQSTASMHAAAVTGQQQGEAASLRAAAGLSRMPEIEESRQTRTTCPSLEEHRAETDFHRRKGRYKQVHCNYASHCNYAVGRKH